MHEERIENDTDLHMRAVAWGGAMIVAGIVFAVTAAWFVYGALRPPAGFDAPNGAPMQVAAPLLEAAPQNARAAYEADKRRLVTSYGWVDRQQGIARIPLDDAMRLMAERAAAGERR